MNFNWYKVYNLDTFEAADLVSRSVQLNLEAVGIKEILLTKGNYVGITYEGVYLPIDMNEKNPFAFDGYAVWVDENSDIWLGIEIED